MLESGLRLALGVQYHRESKKSGNWENKHRKDGRHSQRGRDELSDTERLKQHEARESQT